MGSIPLCITKVKEVLCETYRIFSKYASDELIPKGVADIISETDDFLYYSSIIEDKEKGDGYYNFFEILQLAETIKRGFLEGSYECEFPKLALEDINNTKLIIDLEADSVEFITDRLKGG